MSTLTSASYSFSFSIYLIPFFFICLLLFLLFYFLYSLLYSNFYSSSLESSIQCWQCQWCKGHWAPLFCCDIHFLRWLLGENRLRESQSWEAVVVNTTQCWRTRATSKSTGGKGMIVNGWTWNKEAMALPGSFMVHDSTPFITIITFKWETKYRRGAIQIGLIIIHSRE